MSFDVFVLCLLLIGALFYAIEATSYDNHNG